MHSLILVRHGRTDAGDREEFTGWIDEPLNAAGHKDAHEVGIRLAEADLLPACAHTSTLKRSLQTSDAILAACGRESVPRYASWELNERHYGSLQGRSKREVAAEYGPSGYRSLRRSFDVTPPQVSAEHDHSPHAVGSKLNLARQSPRSESLAVVRDRVEHHWSQELRRGIQEFTNVLVVGHSSSLRVLIMILEELGADEVAELDVPRCFPLVYRFDNCLRLLGPGSYLDPAKAATAAARVAREGLGSPPEIS